MTEEATASQSSELSADAIAAWLSEHPDFFASREMLLADLTLPHASGDAVSLVERQLRLLRDRNAELHRRLRELTDAARANHRIYERTLEITSALVDAVDPQDLVRRLAEGLRSGFDVDATSVRVVDRGGLASSLCGEATAAEVADAARGRILFALLADRRGRAWSPLSSWSNLPRPSSCLRAVGWRHARAWRPLA